MIFLLDTSDKVTNSGFDQMKNLIITTASLLKMSGYESTRLAVFQFSAKGERLHINCGFVNWVTWNINWNISTKKRDIIKHSFVSRDEIYFVDSRCF